MTTPELSDGSATTPAVQPLQPLQDSPPTQTTAESRPEIQHTTRRLHSNRVKKTLLLGGVRTGLESVYVSRNQHGRKTTRNKHRYYPSSHLLQHRQFSPRHRRRILPPVPSARGRRWSWPFRRGHHSKALHRKRRRNHVRRRGNSKRGACRRRREWQAETGEEKQRTKQGETERGVRVNPTDTGTGLHVRRTRTGKNGHTESRRGKITTRLI